MRKKSKRQRPEPFTMKRVLGESSIRLNKQNGSINLNLSDILGALPMTINQDEIQIQAKLQNNTLSIIVFCNETIQSGDVLGGEYEVEED